MDTNTQRRPVPELRQFLSDQDKDYIEACAQRADTNLAYLKQIASGHRLASGKLSRRLEREIPGLKRAHLRPDLFGDLQPEATR